MTARDAFINERVNMALEKAMHQRPRFRRDLRWFVCWIESFFMFVWRWDGYFDPRAKFVSISMAAFHAKVIADACLEIRKENRK